MKRINVLECKALNGINLVQWAIEGCGEQESQRAFDKGSGGSWRMFREEKQ